MPSKKFKESDTVELKRELTPDTAKSIVAFSNSKGGVIYVGVDDKGNVVGVNDPDSVSRQSISMIRDAVRPDVSMSTAVESSEVEGQWIISIDVREGTSKPYYLREKGLRAEGVYVRQGPSSVPVPDSAVQSMLRSYDNRSFELSKSVRQDLTFNSAERFFKERGVLFNTSQKKSLKLIVDDMYTNLAYLLSDQCEIGVKLAVFEGTTKSVFKYREEVTGSVLEQVEEAYKFIDDHNYLRSEIKGLFRSDSREYPEDAVREALVNSIVHRDYSFQASTLISMFDDRLEIISIGGLPGGIGHDDILAGMSLPRNPQLAGIFYRLKLIEVYGTGIPKIIESYGDSVAIPSFEETTNTFRVVLPQVPMPSGAVSSEERKVLSMFGQTDTITRRDAEQTLGISKTAAFSILSEMVDKKRITISGKGRGTKYHLPKK
jgi:ATP-dependent DNA helicase RecG